VQGIHVGTGGPTTEIVEDDDPEVLGLWTHPSINANSDGLVAFHADLGGAREAIMGGSGGVPTIIVDNDGALASLGDPTVNNAGHIAVTATLDVYSTEAVIRSPGGSYTLIADSDGPLASFSNRPGITNSGQVVFRALYDDGWTAGIFTGDGNTLTLVADTTGGTYSDVQSPSINDSGAVAFSAVENMYNPGIFTGPNPVTDKVIMRGDMLFGSPVSAVSMGVASLNDNGQIAFGYSLDDGRTGIALATPSAVIRGDCDGDGDVDLADYGAFPDCLSGPGGGLPAPECACFDFDAGGDIDLRDFAGFQERFTDP
jgi:hypothetical protein